MAESNKPDNTGESSNTFEGLMLGSVENWKPHDPRKIGPNGKAPSEVHPTSFVLGPNHPS
jgi:hypothetical protein